MGRLISSAGVALLALLVFVQPSKADSMATMNFELKGHAFDVTFSTPVTFTPADVSGGAIQLHDITGTLVVAGNPYTFSTIQLSQTGWNGNTFYWAFGSGTKSLAIVLPGLFTWNQDGSVTLHDGTFAIGDYNSFTGGPLDYTLTLVDPPGGAVSTPEPASILLFGVGSLAVAGLRRRKIA